MVEHRFDMFKMGLHFYAYVEKTRKEKELVVESRIDIDKVCLFKTYKRDGFTRMDFIGDRLLFIVDYVIEVFNFSLDGKFTHYIINGGEPYGFDEFNQVTNMN